MRYTYNFFTLAILACILQANCLNFEDISDVYQFTSGNVRTKRDTQTTGSRATEKCSESQVESVFAETDTCMERSDNALTAALESGTGTLLRVLCDTIKIKVTCFDTYGPRCWNANQVDNIKNNFLEIQMETARNQSEVLGDSFIDSCHHLTEHKNNFVQRLYGSNKCSYTEALSIKSNQDKCIETAKQQKTLRDNSINFLSTRTGRITAYVKSHCSYKSNFYRCFQQNTFTCSSEKSIKEDLIELNKLFKEIEDSVREKGINLDNCPRSL